MHPPLRLLLSALRQSAPVAVTVITYVAQSASTQGLLAVPCVVGQVRGQVSQQRNSCSSPASCRAGVHGCSKRAASTGYCCIPPSCFFPAYAFMAFVELHNIGGCHSPLLLATPKDVVLHAQAKHTGSEHARAWSAHALSHMHTSAQGHAHKRRHSTPPRPPNREDICTHMRATHRHLHICHFEYRSNPLF